MSSPFAYLLSCSRRADKAAKKMAQQLADIDPMNRTYDEIYNTQLDLEFRRITGELKLMQRLKGYIQEDLQEVLAKPERLAITAGQKDHWYMITIRPAEGAVNFNVFRAKIEEYLARKCFLDYKYSFEQKGQSWETLGHGFHVHIVANTKHTSKANLLRDTLSSFNRWIEKGHVAQNCINVLPVSNPEEMIQRYLIDYHSDDDHKIVTKEYDEKWRTLNHLAPIYSFTACPSSSGTCIIEEAN